MQVGEFPFFLDRNLGLRLIRMPPYTRLLEPKITLPESGATRAALNQLRVLKALVAKLPAHDRLEICLPPQSDLVLPFTGLNYAVTHHFTFRATEPQVDEETLLRQMDQKTRNSIRSARTRLGVEQSVDIDRFLRLSKRQRVDSAHIADADVIERIFAACEARGQGAVMVAREQDGGGDVAAAVVVWDANTLYYWLAARDPQTGPAGANLLLMHESRRLAQRLNLTFDSDGFLSPDAVPFHLKLGLTPVVRPWVNGGSGLWRLMRAIKLLAQPGRVDRYYRV